MGIVDEPVEDGVGIGRTADQLVPFRDRKLAGDERGTTTISILEDFQKMMPGIGFERFQPLVVEDQQLDLAEALQARRNAAVTAG
ncbi:hypothetical protein SAMN06295937_101515 [Sphingopyxis flava]|uniref:Uncharacterized protein n=1 Tax=Sphingopyxis flava TaxID=1507287 RepID=A0A1T5DKG5_9SPHN|nr:hypothetical protein SAMN06295937_101515 [Sphingopyxis flava]